MAVHLPTKAMAIRLLLLLSAAAIAVAGVESDSLLRFLSDLGYTVSGDPCLTLGVTCDASGAATRITLPDAGLAGFLSPAVGRLPALRELSIPGNRLSGGLPRELARCRALRVLDLRGNRLSGNVPREVGSLSNLRSLDLSSNRLSGNISFLRRFPYLENLSLAGNLFSGPVPRSLNSFPKLRHLDLSNNPSLVTQPASDNSPRRRSLLPNRYIFAENATKAHNSTNNSSRKGNSSSTATAPAPAPSSSPSHHHHKHKHRVRNWIIGFLVGSVAGVVSGLILSVLFRLLINCIRGRYKNPGGPSIFSPIIKRAEHLAFLEKEDGLASLEVIGRGGCGEVYKAELPGTPERPGRAIAIKKVMRRNIDNTEPTDEESKLLDKWMRQIRSEIRTVGYIRHRNLLPLLAHVPRPDCHYLIYEYMKNGSLQDVLKEVWEGRRELDWLMRHKIATGIAAGLEYLHIHHKPQIIHRDLKPANILLDDDMEARIADFGLAKEMPDTNTHITTSNLAGTVGYIAPEYHQTLKFTAKCDIYSFGVILAALVIGKTPSDDFFQETHEMSLVKWVRNMMNSPNPRAAIDNKLVGNGFEEQMLLVLKIACFCTVDEPKERPNSKEIRSMLSQIKHR
ncbi:leucine-rich repeat receptor-like serine/threonine/tyrosine-protein kinase SOBIR1 [Elaeis guineensis]|uniref:Leucine-rich repeat receptor-like serine/threonine/tyrosine-protein kinase SOBIR1 n=1 Tax=Elaeis guineensis var. tenera TaxID=51953 RepID=A0A6I9Q7D9_ELAGV|nr:leucine-rich repeat receptor-like serine/threonine/tyrosine-protein kinase SOBIR1 [Elaeis guineensis]